MTIPVPQPEEPPMQAMNARPEPLAVTPFQPSDSQPLILARPPEGEDALKTPSFYLEDEQLDPATAFVAPFQLSDALPSVPARGPSAEPASTAFPLPAVPPSPSRRKRRWSLPMIALVVCGVVIVGGLLIGVLAQATPPLQTRGAGSPLAGQHKPTTNPIPPQNANGQGPSSGDWIPQHLPAGWTNAGLQTGDGIQAMRVAATFNDREMSLDYRSVGTRQNHGGTFTAATFVLTLAALQRFRHNDVRVINNTLFDRVATTKLIRLVVNPQPQLVAFAQQGQQQVAWVDVAFQLWQSQIDPTHPTRRVEGKELDPTTGQPRLHHMMVLLLRVPSQDAEANPPMGGTGWLVSNYDLDLPDGTTLDIVQPA